MDFQAIYEHIQNHARLKGTNGLARSKELANLAYKKFLINHRWSFNKKTDAAIAISATSNIISAPIDWASFAKEGLTIPAEKQKILHRTEDDFFTDFPNLVDGTDEGKPAFYTEYGWDDATKKMQFVIGPWPNKAYTAQGRYHYTPPDMSGDTDEPHMPEALRHYLKTFGETLAGEFLDEKRRLDQIMTMAVREFAALVHQDEAREDRDRQMTGAQSIWVQARSRRRNG